MYLRTKKNLAINPKIYRYTNDGQGRDTYITYSVIKNSNYFPPVPSSPKQHVNKSHDLSLRKPIKRYFVNGKGRDLYIQQTIFDNTNNYSGDVSIENCLRNNTEINEVPVQKGYSKFEKKLIDRIFYGKCIGLNTRYMSPKVVFAKRKSDEEKSLNDNLENDEIKENSENEGDDNEDKDKEKKVPYLYEPKLTQEKLSESVRKIFLFNNKLNFISSNKGKDKAWY